MQKTILVVDDEPMNTKLIKFILDRDPDYRVFTAGSGEEALGIIEEENVELVLLDVNMPGMNGYETLRRIRETSQIPVVFLTADDEKDHPGHEADGFLKKPVMANALLEMAAQLL